MARQSQSLATSQQLAQRLSPHMVRLGRMLEMSETEFDDSLLRAADENPALIINDPDSPAPDSMVDDEGRHFSETADDLIRADYSSDEDIPDYRTRQWGGAPADRYIPEATDFAEAPFPPLRAQLVDLSLDPSTLDAALFVADSLDSNGYLTRSDSELAYDMAVATGIDVAPETVATAVGIVRSLDPAGIAARGLRDCLLLQLDRLEPSEAVDDATNIITQTFELYAAHSYDAVCRALDISRRRLDAASRVILSLNPRPGTLLEAPGADERMRQISPDFIVEPDARGRLTVALTGRSAHLGIDPAFELPDSDTHADTDTERFIRRRRAEALSVVSLAQRRNATLLAVMRAIVAHQPEFFHTFDPADLRPMVLRDIVGAAAIDLSTASRATATKYVMTPRGMFPLKSLFSESAGASADISGTAAESAVRHIIEDEDKSAPLSDEAIARRLRAAGIDLARRTVTKYRERLGIPPARLRRK